MGCLKSARFAQARRGQLTQERMENTAYTRCIEQHGTMKRQLSALSQAVTRLSGDLCEDVALDDVLGRALEQALACAGISARVVFTVRVGGRIRAML